MKTPNFFLALTAAAVFASLFSVGPAQAKSLTKSEIRSIMVGKPLYTRRFGVPITMVYRSNGTVSAKAILGTSRGTWRYRGNQVCTTFPSGPAKGTSCASFTKTGPDRYRSSKGVNFRVGG